MSRIANKNTKPEETVKKLFGMKVTYLKVPLGVRGKVHPVLMLLHLLK